MLTANSFDTNMEIHFEHTFDFLHVYVPYLLGRI
jgi:hypothetical protein